MVIKHAKEEIHNLRQTMTPSKLKLPKGGLSNSVLWLAENNQAISCQSQRIFKVSARYQLSKYHDRYITLYHDR